MQVFTATQAVRAVDRLLRPSREANELGRIADAGFDGGEFSGPWHNQKEYEEEQHALHLVSARMNIPVSEIERESMRQIYDYMMYQ